MLSRVICSLFSVAASLLLFLLPALLLTWPAAAPLRTLTATSVSDPVATGVYTTAVVTDSVIGLPWVSKALPSGVTDLGVLEGSWSSASVINNSDQVAGSGGAVTGNSHAFFWQQGVMTDLGTLGGDVSVAIAINERGQVAGFSARSLGPDVDYHAFFWADGVMTDVGTVMSGSFRDAIGLNVHGTVIGNSPSPTGLRGFVWAAGVITDLGSLGGDVTGVQDINDRGQVVGQSDTADGRSHAFLWESGVMTDIGLAWGGSSVATAVNEHSQVAGVYCTSLEPPCRGFLWAAGVITDIGDLGSGISRIEALNERGEIVGYAKDPSGGPDHAFLWQEGVLTDLGPAPSFVTYPLLLNDEGVIVMQRLPGGSTIQQPFAWRNGIFTQLPTRDGTGSARVWGINDRGHIAGDSDTAAGSPHALLWDASR